MIKTFTGLKRYLRAQIEYQKGALAADDPMDTCAAEHRGEIRAMVNALKQLSTETAARRIEVEYAEILLRP